MSKEKNEAYLKTNDPSYIEIKSLAYKHGIDMESLFANEKFDDEVVDILYPHMPKLLRMLTSKETFKKGYAAKRGTFIEKFKSIEKK